MLQLICCSAAIVASDDDRQLQTLPTGIYIEIRRRKLVRIVLNVHKFIIMSTVQIIFFVSPSSKLTLLIRTDFELINVYQRYTIIMYSRNVYSIN